LTTSIFIVPIGCDNETRHGLRPSFTHTTGQAHN
jgi:hypothetical protein